MADSDVTSRAGTTSGRIRYLGTWVLRVALAVIFLGAGAAKLAGDGAMVDLFAEVGAGQWLRYVVGLAEVLGAVGLLVPRLVILASLGLALLMAGATISNLTVLDDNPALTVVLFLAAVLIFLERRSALAAAPGGAGRR